VTALAAFLERATATLAAAGVAGPRQEARWLVDALLGLRRLDGARRLSAAEEARLEAALARRAAREPLDRIEGAREFWSLGFRLSPATLSPRPDSETLVAAALDLLGDRARPWRLLDLGSGSGCLLLALLSELPAASGLGIDLAPGAVATATENAERLGLAARARFLVDDWGQGQAGPFDLAVSNPPYIATGALPALEPEVRNFDPALALDGGADGLAAYRALLPQARRLLAPGAWLVLELGQGQAAAVGNLAVAAGLTHVSTRNDLAGIARALVARQPVQRRGG
jgi:release factor glutamine methyltransferase